jgi:CRISPR/Cas system CSM-associated protein Csm5 (group 7 of RAMP superfamily)
MNENEARESMTLTINNAISEIDEFVSIDPVTTQQIEDIYNKFNLCVDTYFQYEYFHPEVERKMQILNAKFSLLQVKLNKDLAVKNNLQTNTILNYEIRISNSDAAVTQLKKRIDDYGIPE